MAQEIPYDGPLEPIADEPTGGQRMTPEDDAHLSQLFKTGSAEQIIDFVSGHPGLSLQPDKVKAFTDARDKGASFDPHVKYSTDNELPQGAEEVPADTELDPVTADTSLLHNVGVGANGFLQGLGDLADAYSGRTATNMVAGSLGGEGGVSASGSVADLGERLGVDPQNDAQRLGFAAARGAGGAAPFAIGAGIPAAALAIGSGAASGLASEGTKEAGYGPGWQLAAGLAAGVAPGALASVVRRGLAPVADFVTTAGASRRAGSMIERAASGSADDIAGAIQSADAPVAGVQPTLAEVANDPGIAGFQRSLANSRSDAGTAIGERHAQNALARTRAVSAEMGDGSPQAIQDMAASDLATAEAQTAQQQAARQAAADARIASGQAAATETATGATNNLAQTTARVGEIADRDATASGLRETFDPAYSEAKQATSAAYGAEPLVKPQPIKVPQSVHKAVREDADAFYGDGGGEVPAPLRAIIGDMESVHTTTRTLTNIDRRLADFAGEARMAGRKSEAAFAERVRSTLGDFVQKAAPKAYRDAIANAKRIRAEQGRRFETGPVASAFARDRYGNPMVGDTTLPSKLIRPGPAGGDTIDGLISAIGPEATESAVRQELRRVVEEAPIRTEEQARKLAVRYGEVARRFPGLQDDLAAIQNSAAQLENAESGLATAFRAKPTPAEAASIKERSAIHDAILDSPIAKFADSATDPNSAVTSLLRRSDGGRQLSALWARVKSKPDAVAGLRRSLGDYIETAGQGPNFTQSGERIPSVAKTREAISTVVSRAGKALTDSQKIVLKRVERELEKANFAFTAGRPAGSDTAMNLEFNGLLKAFPGAGKAKAMLNIITDVLGNGKQVQQVLNKAVLDPDFAATLLKRPTPKHWEQLKQGLRTSGATGGAEIIRPDFTRGLGQAFGQGGSVRAAAEQKQDNGPGAPAVTEGYSPNNQPYNEGLQP